MTKLFKPEDYPNLLVGLDGADDSAIYKISDDYAIVFTTDFFPPIVDDPYEFGAIAAANALSDIYAMGGEVIMALNLVAFPPKLDDAILVAILKGGADKVKEAGGVIAGGHTINDNEPKYGLAVVGKVHPGRIWRKSGAQLGDILILTKSLGVGIITTALKKNVADPFHVERAVAGMAKLNRDAAEIARDFSIHAATDITGFALTGHALELAQNSMVQLRIRYESLPFLPGAELYAAAGHFPGGAQRNRSAYDSLIIYSDDMPEHLRTLVNTPETSGGLLLAVAPEDSTPLVTRLRDRGAPAEIIGVVEPGQGLRFDYNCPPLVRKS